jgi:hypothetical protein
MLSRGLSAHSTAFTTSTRSRSPGEIPSCLNDHVKTITRQSRNQKRGGLQSPPFEGGVAAPFNKYREATLAGAAGVVRLTIFLMLRPVGLAGSAPGRSNEDASRHFICSRGHPSFESLRKEGIAIRLTLGCGLPRYVFCGS